MTQVRIRRVEDGAGDLIRASVSIWLVDADSKRRVAWHSAGGPITEITNLSLTADEIVDLMPQADIALDAAGTATRYLVRIIAQPEALRHPVTEDWYIQVPDSVDIKELDDLVGATGIEAGSLVYDRLLPASAAEGQIARYTGGAWVVDYESVREPVVASADDVRNLTWMGDRPARVQTLSALTLGDGGGGPWRWDATSVADDTLGTVLLPTGHVGPGRWLRDWANDIEAIWFGLGEGDATINAAAFQAAADYWAEITRSYSPHNASSWTGPALIFPGGRHSIDRAITIAPRCGVRGTGNCVLVGSGTKSHVGLDCDAKYGFVEGVGFENFSVAVQFITQNVASARWSFKDIEVWSCTKGISSVSYSASRSTVVSISGFRFADTTTALELYCDKQSIRDVNGRTTSPQTTTPYFILDGLVELSNCLMIPLASSVVGGRWINFGGTSAGNAARGLTINNCRFSSETSGSMPVVYNYEPGDDTTRIGSYICMNNSQLSVDHGGSGGKGAAVVLAEVGGESTMPGFISFNQCSLLASSGEVQLVRRETDTPLNTTATSYRIIDADEVTIRNCSREAPTTYPPVENELLPYVKGQLRRYYTKRAENCNATAYPSGSIEFDILDGRTKECAVGTGCELTTILNANTGDEVSIVSKNANLTVKHLAPNIYVMGAADVTIPTGGAMTFAWLPSWSTGRWAETSRTF